LPADPGPRGRDRGLGDARASEGVFPPLRIWRIVRGERQAVVAEVEDQLQSPILSLLPRSV
jgi:hypothetical protein